MLDYLIEGLTHARRLDGIALATSTDPTDDPTATFAQRRGVACYRGSLEHVAMRLLRAGEDQQAEAIVRVNGDSPLLDPSLVDHAVSLFQESSVDIVTNVHPRTFPKGQSVEVISLRALRMAVESMSDANEREHVTTYIYAHSEAFSIVSFAANPPRPDVQLSIDDATDFERCREILAAIGGPPWQVGWRACVAAYDQCMAATRRESSR
jgi:spore coat polysaccharide biosynthesis protein SpsF